MKRGTSPHCQYHLVDLDWDQRPIWHCRRSLHLATASADFIFQLLPSRRRQVTSVRRTRGWVSHVPYLLATSNSAQKPLLKWNLTTWCQLHNMQSAEPGFLRLNHLIGRFLNAIPCSSVWIRHDNSTARYFVFPIHASAEKTSTNMVFMVSRAGVRWSSFATQRRQRSHKALVRCCRDSRQT